MNGVSVIIPNWNGAPRLSVLLHSLRTQSPVDLVTVVDNGSSDDSVQLARKAGARVIELASNCGFAAAVNRGVRETSGEWLLVLNNDVEPGEAWLATLLAAASSNAAWFATGKLLNSERRDLVDGTYDALCRGGTAWRCGEGRLDGPAWNTPKRIGLAPFTAILIRKELFDRAGLLDETFESYLEDVEFGIRCSKKGLFGVYVPKAVAYHQGSATLGRWHPATVRRMARNQILLVAKHYPRRWVRKCGWHVLVAQGLWGLLAARHGCAWPWIQGKVDGVLRFQACRAAGAGDESILQILACGENEIRELQRRTGTDLYWRLYFALT